MLDLTRVIFHHTLPILTGDIQENKLTRVIFERNQPPHYLRVNDGNKLTHVISREVNPHHIDGMCVAHPSIFINPSNQTHYSLHLTHIPLLTLTDLSSICNIISICYLSQAFKTFLS